MAATSAEQVFEKHGVKTFKRGQRIRIDFDLGVVNDLFSPEFLKSLGSRKNFKASGKFYCIPDYLTPPDSIASANTIKALRSFARDNHIEFSEIGRSGVVGPSLADEGRVLPGHIVIGAEPHILTIGAVGAIGLRLSEEALANALVDGSFELCVDALVQVRLSGELPQHSRGFDLALHVLKMFGAGGWKGKIVEFSGESVINLPMAERFKLCHFAAEMGAVSALFAPDERCLDFLKRRTKQSIVRFASDGGRFDQVVDVDLSKVDVLVRVPGGEIKSIKEVRGQKVDTVFIGSDAGGYYDDIAAAADMLRGRSVMHPTQLLVVPATRGAYEKVLAQGLMEDLIACGANVAFPTKGPFIGRHTGVLGPGQTGLATFSRNADGQMGDPLSKLFLGSSIVAAASALKGELCHPAEI